MDEAGVQSWLNRYIDVWRSGQPDRVAELFTGDCAYIDEPYSAPKRGLKEIAQYWQQSGDPPDAFRANYDPVHVDADFAVAQGTSIYLTDDRKAVAKEYFNVFLLWFAPDGRCREYREWYMLRPKEPAVAASRPQPGG